VRVLWVTDEVPDLTKGGGSIRQHNLLRVLAERVECDVLLLGSWTDPALRSKLGEVIELPRPPDAAPATGWLFRRLKNLAVVLFARDSYEVAGTQAVRAALAPALEALVASGRYDVIHLEHAYLGPLVDVVRGAGPDGPEAEITLQNLSSLRSAQTAAVQTGRRHRWRWNVDARRCERFERSLVDRFDRVIVVSDDDAAKLPPPVVVVPNGVDLAAFPMTALPAERRMLFSGSLAYIPNIDGALWFCQEVLPEVRRLVPDARLSLVGREPVAEVAALADLEGVDAHFDVPAIRPYVEAARVSVVPLRAGSGTRLKALEAMAAGRPLAGTTIGLEGLGLVDGESAVIRDDAPGLAAGIAQLLTDDADAERTRAAAAGLAAAFDWDVIVDRFLAEVGEGVGS
jgi:glycosyltransferase involved in cell wall biosynthesis